MISSPHDSPFILVLCVPRFSRNSDGVIPYGGAKYRWGIKIARFSTNKSLYLANDTRYRHGCYGRRIGTHTRSIISNDLEWILTLFSRSGHSLMLKYLQNDCRYGNSYHRRRIGNHTQAFEWHQFQWPWETSKPVFKVTILFNVK